MGASPDHKLALRTVPLPVSGLSLLTDEPYEGVFHDGHRFLQLVIHNVNSDARCSVFEKLRTAEGVPLGSRFHAPMERCMVSCSDDTVTVETDLTRHWFMISDDQFVTQKLRDALCPQAASVEPIGTLLATRVAGASALLPPDLCPNMPQGETFMYRIFGLSDAATYLTMSCPERAALCLVWRGIPIMYSRPDQGDASLRVVDTGVARNLVAAVPHVGKLRGLYCVSTHPVGTIALTRKGDGETHEKHIQRVYSYDLNGCRLATERVTHAPKYAVLDLRWLAEPTDWVLCDNGSGCLPRAVVTQEGTTLAVGKFLCSEPEITIHHVV